MEKQLYSAGFDQIREQFFQTGDAAAALDARSRLVDEIVLAGFPPLDKTALLAVGGYGRREMFPYSDVDLLFLTESDRVSEGLKEPLGPFLRSLWDAGLRVSQSVHTIDECVELNDQNIELTISLLDHRFLSGDRGVFDRLVQRLGKFLPGRRDDLSRHLSQMTRERHAKFQNTIYHLEPNVKEAPGGLRDYQVLRWSDQIAGKSAENNLQTATLFRLRCDLHYRSNRDNNSLSFDLQDELSREPDVLMRSYFRDASAIHRSCLRVLEAIETRRSKLFAQFRTGKSRLSNADFSVVDERVFFRAPQQLRSQPELPLQLFLFVARHGIRLAPDTATRMSQHRIEAPQPIWPALRDILRLPHADLALRAMHETGILQQIFPELHEIDSLVIRDFYHRYTVDEHTLVAIQTVLRFRHEKDNPFAELANEVDDMAILLISLLFHDVGKGNPDEGHVDASVRIAQGALARVQMPESDWDAVRFLIGSHLELSSAMNSRDPSDAATAAFVAQRTGTVERLKLLTLLTYGDISAVNPAAMTPWRRGLLWQLYTAVHQELTRGLEKERIHLETDDRPERRRFLEGLPARYLRTHSEPEIQQHLQLERASAELGAGVALVRNGAVYRLAVVTPDRPFLFASIAGALASFGMNILKAEAFSNSAGTVVDAFTFDDPMRTLELNPPERGRLESIVRKAVLGQVEARDLLKGRPRAQKRPELLAPKVSVDGSASESATLIHIVAEDRPGLLYDLASALSGEGCNIEVVLIDTEAHKAIDVFYVTANGAKLVEAHAERVRDKLIEACVLR